MQQHTFLSFIRFTQKGRNRSKDLLPMITCWLAFWNRKKNSICKQQQSNRSESWNHPASLPVIQKPKARGKANQKSKHAQCPTTFTLNSPNLPPHSPWTRLVCKYCPTNYTLVHALYHTSTKTTMHIQSRTQYNQYTTIVPKVAQLINKRILNPPNTKPYTLNPATSSQRRYKHAPTVLRIYWN